MNRRLALVAALALCLLAAGWEIASPHVSVRSMRDAARRGDAAGVSAYVDYAALRESLKGEVNHAIAKRIARGSGQGMGTIALALASRASSAMIDTMVNPKALEAAMARPHADSNPLARTWKTQDVELSRTSFSKFTVSNPTDPKAPHLVFTRHWPIWKLSGVETPGETELLP